MQYRHNSHPQNQQHYKNAPSNQQPPNYPMRMQYVLPPVQYAQPTTPNISNNPNNNTKRANSTNVKNTFGQGNKPNNQPTPMSISTKNTNKSNKTFAPGNFSFKATDPPDFFSEELHCHEAEPTDE
ncbi:hypothetical protein TKK_0009872 [Trichogramma kaykai]